MAAELALLQRDFVPMLKSESRRGIRIASFNILADGLAQSGGFVHASPEILQFEYRLPLIISELARSDADLICLAEANHFDLIQKHMSDRGYEGIFSPKDDAPAAKCSTESIQYPPDGVAIFYRRALFAPIGQPCKFSSGPVQAILHLRYLGSNASFPPSLVISMMHLKAKDTPENIAKRAYQSSTAISRARSLCATDTSDSLIMCGDFNAEHHEPAVTNLTDSGLHNAYAGQPWWSTFKARQPSHFDQGGVVKRCIDYIFTSPNLKPQCLWAPPDIDDRGLPSASYPSDHIAIAAEFVLAQGVDR